MCNKRFLSVWTCCFLVLCLSIDVEAKSDSPIEYKYNSSIATMFQNEANYISEWIDFHRM